MSATYNGTTVEVVDEESHHGEEMVKIDGPGLNGWVFREEIDVDED